MCRVFTSTLIAAGFSTWLSAQTWDREDVGFQEIQRTAEDLASKPYVAPDTNAMPGWMKSLTYDQYRDIRFNPGRALWAAEGLPFRAMFFHPGYLYREPVKLHEFTGSHQQEIRLAEAYFNYGPLIANHGELPPDGSFSGFRLHAALNNPSYYDDLIVFQGASYWRALGKGQVYGISSRGLALNTGPDMSEEFPGFREFWLRKPGKNDSQARFYALLDSPSCAGAYSFRIVPGADTMVDVHAVVFPRKGIRRFGIAPMSSMFWFGENSRRRFDDFRPEVHDSDGLCIRMGSGERIWRPLCNDSGRIETSFFGMDECAGFGLLQRDRHFTSYEDAEANYSKRPSLWIEPTSNWGAGRVMLMELATNNEMEDNVVAMWEPADDISPGKRLDFSYRQHWTMDPDPSLAGAYVVATRTGVDVNHPRKRTVIIDFQSDYLATSDENPLQAFAEAVGEQSAMVRIEDIQLNEIRHHLWRVSFQFTPADDAKQLSDLPPIELRCFLKRGENYLSETWSYKITP